MTTSAVTAEVARYAAQVRVALADLPASDREELLEDLEGHLLEVRSEQEGPLELRLGRPEAYAAELRASAGLPSAPGADRGRTSLLRQAEAGLRRDVGRVRAAVLAAPGGRAAVDFLPELRPGWWVLRAWIAVWVLVMVFDSVPIWSAFPVPTVAGSAGLGLLLLAAAVVLSVRLGRGQGPAQLRAPRLIAAGNVALVLAAFVLASSAQSRFTLVSGPAYAGGPVYGSPGVLTAADGRHISNLYAFDALGRPLRDVQLYDQDGRPVDTLALAAPDGSYAEPEYRLDESGTPRGNVFPRSLTTEAYTERGPSPAAVPPPAIAPARLAGPSPTPSSTPTGTPGPTATGSASPAATAVPSPR